ncbi:MAG: DUF4349 domain-containing protein [Christensenellales bacterium]
MKKKLLLSVVCIILACLCFLSVGCAKNNDMGGGYYPNNSGPESTDKSESGSDGSSTETSPDRKIIYSVYVSYVVDNLEGCEESISSKLKNDEWVESSSLSQDYATVVVRIKTERLDEFMSSLDGLGEISSYTKESEDISERYYDKTVRKTALENEQTRLLELQEKATTLADLLAINTRLSEIDAELASINGTLNKYDSLVEYSTVTINLRVTYQGTEYTFWDQLLDGLSIGLDIAGGLLIFIICAIPYGAVATGIFFLVRYLVRRNKAKKAAKEAAKREQDNRTE